MGNSDYGEILYSSDGSGKNLAAKKKGSKKSFVEIDPAQTTLKLRMEKKGRGGKTVTVIYELPNNPPYWQKLTKKLKNHCGSGGALKGDTIEVQGEQREKVRSFLEGLGFTVKG